MPPKRKMKKTSTEETTEEKIKQVKTEDVEINSSTFKWINHNLVNLTPHDVQIKLPGYKAFVIPPVKDKDGKLLPPLRVTQLNERHEKVALASNHDYNSGGPIADGFDSGYGDDPRLYVPIRKVSYVMDEECEKSLPPFVHGRLYIVSMIVADAAKKIGRNDFIVPDSGPSCIRDDKGRIVASTCFIQP